VELEGLVIIEEVRPTLRFSWEAEKADDIGDQ
jgi:hypothetical protein